MKEFTNVAGRVTSFAGRVNFFCPSWISCIGAWFERLSEIFWNHFHPERVVSFKERAERGWKIGASSLSWKSEWNPCTLATNLEWLDLSIFTPNGKSGRHLRKTIKMGRVGRIRSSIEGIFHPEQETIWKWNHKSETFFSLVINNLILQTHDLGFHIIGDFVNPIKLQWGRDK